MEPDSLPHDAKNVFLVLRIERLAFFQLNGGQHFEIGTLVAAQRIDKVGALRGRQSDLEPALGIHRREYFKQAPGAGEHHGVVPRRKHEHCVLEIFNSGPKSGLPPSKWQTARWCWLLLNKSNQMTMSGL
jgi:hypothetical protein